MNAGRRRHDPFAPRRRTQSTPLAEAPGPLPTPEAPAEPTKPAPDFTAILDAIPNDIDHITLKELRALAAQAGVADYGTKAELIARIRAAAEQ